MHKGESDYREYFITGGNMGMVCKTKVYLSLHDVYLDDVEHDDLTTIFVGNSPFPVYVRKSDIIVRAADANNKHELADCYHFEVKLPDCQLFRLNSGDYGLMLHGQEISESVYIPSRIFGNMWDALDYLADYAKQGAQSRRQVDPKRNAKYGYSTRLFTVPAAALGAGIPDADTVKVSPGAGQHVFYASADELGDPDSPSSEEAIVEYCFYNIMLPGEDVCSLMYRLFFLRNGDVGFRTVYLTDGHEWQEVDYATRIFINIQDGMEYLAHMIRALMADQRGYHY